MNNKPTKANVIKMKDRLDLLRLRESADAEINSLEAANLAFAKHINTLQNQLTAIQELSDQWEKLWREGHLTKSPAEMMGELREGLK